MFTNHFGYLCECGSAKWCPKWHIGRWNQDIPRLTPAQPSHFQGASGVYSPLGPFCLETKKGYPEEKKAHVGSTPLRGLGFQRHFPSATGHIVPCKALVLTPATQPQAWTGSRSSRRAPFVWMFEGPGNWVNHFTSLILFGCWGAIPHINHHLG